MKSDWLIGVKEICDYLCISRTTYYKYVKTDLPIHKKHGIIRACALELDEWLKN